MSHRVLSSEQFKPEAGHHCAYCEEHHLYEESPWLRKTGERHAIEGQQTLFDPEKYR